MTAFSWLMTTHNRRSEIKTDKPKQEPFQNIIDSNFFGLRLIVVSNWLLNLAVLCKMDESIKDAQTLLSRYFFTQLWGEFTIEVLHEFNFEDVEYRKK